jgi:predicted  nucleic acid-binding Zn-ribbon protein
MQGIDDKIKDSETKRKSYQKEVDATKQKIKDLRDSATKDIADINRQLADLTQSGANELAQRYAEVVNALAQ